MRGLLSCLLLSMGFVICTQAKAVTFAEALKSCKGQNTEYCRKVKELYLKRVNEIRSRNQIKGPRETAPVSTVTAKAPVDNGPKIDKRGEIKSPFGLGYFSEISGIGKENDAGESQLEMYAHLKGSYKTRFGWKAFLQVPIVIDLALNGDDKRATMLDPIVGASGTLWEQDKWSWDGYVRAYLPLSEGSVDDGVTMKWKIKNGITYSADAFDIYLASFMGGTFYGFGSDGERNNGSLSFELGIEGIELSENSFFFASYTTGFNRKVGEGLGYLSYNKGGQALSANIGYKVNKYISIVPGINYKFVDGEMGIVCWFWGSFF